MGENHNEEPFFQVTVDELGADIVKKARDFAVKVVAETYDRFSYSKERRTEVIFIGKISEEVFVRFAREKLGVELTVNYDVYPGSFNVDSNDFVINGSEIDIKSSKDTKDEGIPRCYDYFNFPVPTDQTVKDITLSILYDNDVKTFYLVSWIDKETYLSKCVKRNLPVGGGKVKEFYLYPLRKGQKISELKAYLRK